METPPVSSGEPRRHGEIDRDALVEKTFATEYAVGAAQFGKVRGDMGYHM